MNKLPDIQAQTDRTFFPEVSEDITHLEETNRAKAFSAGDFRVRYKRR